MRATTGQILGKAHRLCEWVRHNPDPKIGDTGSAIAAVIADAAKWHIGEPNELPDADREIIDSLPIRLPVRKMFIESDVMVRMADGSLAPGGWFQVCMDNDNNSVDVMCFQSVQDRFQFAGVAQLAAVNGKRDIFPLRDASFNYSDAQLNLIKKGIRVVERTLLALACTNVKSVESAPPAALNKKRLKQGKFPLFTYKTLHVLAGERGASHDPRADDAEAKRSPRLHFRRGHVRRIGGGRITWVQQCMVGNGRLGVIEKAYALEAR